MEKRERNKKDVRRINDRERNDQKSLLLPCGIRKNDRFVLEIKSEERILERLDGLVYRSCVGSMNGERGKISRQRESNAKFRPIEAESNNGRDPLAEGIGGDTHVTGVSRG